MPLKSGPSDITGLPRLDAIGEFVKMATIGCGPCWHQPGNRGQMIGRKIIEITSSRTVNIAPTRA